MKSQITFAIAVSGIAFLCGCVSPHGGPWCPPLEWIASIDGKSTNSPPNIEGTDGTSPQSALSIRTNEKAYLQTEELDWMHHRYWQPLTPSRPWTDYRQSWNEFRPNASHETRRIGRSVYDIVIVKLPTGETHTNYFDVTRQRLDWPRIR